MNKQRWIGLGVALVAIVTAFHYVKIREDNELSDMQRSYSELATSATEQLRATEDTIFSDEVDIVQRTQGDLMAYKVKVGQASIISVDCNAENASVYADGTLMGRTKANYEYGQQTVGPYLIFALSIPKEGRDASKSRQIMVSKNGYQSFETAVVLDRREIDLKVSLTRKSP
jgi:hypothetical protein